MELMFTIWKEDDEWVMSHDLADDPAFVVQTCPYESKVYGECNVHIAYRPEQNFPAIYANEDEFSWDSIIVQAMVESYLNKDHATFYTGIPDEREWRYVG